MQLKVFILFVIKKMDKDMEQEKMNKNDNLEPNVLADRYCRNFTFRLTTDQRQKLIEYSQKLKIKPTKFIREALNFYYERLDGDEEIKRVNSMELDQLPLLINDLHTSYGYERLKQRFMEAK